MSVCVQELAFVKQREEDANSLRYFCSCCKTRCVVLDKVREALRLCVRLCVSASCRAHLCGFLLDHAGSVPVHKT